MSKKDFFPRAEGALILWLTTYKKKLPDFKVTLGLTDAEIDEQVAFCDALIEKLEANAAAQSAAQEARKNADIQAKTTETGIRKQVKNIKTRKDYTAAMGEALGIVGDEQSFNPAEMKPVIQALKMGKGVELKWTKGNADAIRFEVDRGSGFVFLSIDTVPHYTDSETSSAPAQWKYRAIYLIKDVFAGQWSDVVSVNVG